MAQANEISKIEPQRSTEVATTSESAAILSIIERAASNPAVDIDKMERLLEMQRQVRADNAKRAFSAGLAEMQPDLPRIAERGKGHNDKRYALWEDVNEKIRPVLARHGFALTFRTGQGDGKISVTAVLTHREGHSEETTMFLPSDASGSKNPVQAVGSSTSYGKRYTALALLNITTGGEDDDGKAAGVGDLISDEQLEDLRALVAKTDADVRRFCSAYRIDALPNLPAAKFDDAMAKLRQKEARK
ncbi:ERF family protein [Methylopila sp. 73B]|uniref:ERF family protein n=1 Tax=Methylopila sp. 73B TaxID=1120792 RepID=UPI0005681411|nr:ERF family protein [Methylopila sp. 73B]